jgi:hypothetical protein
VSVELEEESNSTILAEVGSISLYDKLVLRGVQLAAALCVPASEHLSVSPFGLRASRRRVDPFR